MAVHVSYLGGCYQIPPTCIVLLYTPTSSVWEHQVHTAAPTEYIIRLRVLLIFQVFTCFAHSPLGLLVCILNFQAFFIFWEDQPTIYNVSCRCYSQVVCPFILCTFFCLLVFFVLGFIFMQTFFFLCIQFIRLFLHGFWISSHSSKGLAHSKVLKEFLLFISRTFRVLFFTFKSLIHLEFILGQDEMYRGNFVFSRHQY